MTTRISDERLAELKQYHRHSVNQIDEDTWRALLELEQSRVLITQHADLMAQLRMLSNAIQVNSSAMAQYFGRQLDSLLSAHGAQVDKEEKEE